MYPYIQLGPNIVIPTYILVLSIVYSICVIWAVARAKRFNLKKTDALDIGLALMLGGLIGSRLTHAFYEQPEHYLKNPLDIFKVWQGGFVFYGGAIAAFISAFYLIKKRKLSLRQWLDFFAPITAFGYGVGRLSCFFAGCCYGEVCHLPWGVHLHSLGDPAGTLRHPTPLYAFFWEIGVLFILLGLEQNRSSHKRNRFVSTLKQSGFLFFVWLTLHGLGRLLMEAYRADYRGPEIFNMSIASLISVGVTLAGGLGLAFFVSQSQNKGTSR